MYALHITPVKLYHELSRSQVALRAQGKYKKLYVSPTDGVAYVGAPNGLSTISAYFPAGTAAFLALANCFVTFLIVDPGSGVKSYELV